MLPPTNFIFNKVNLSVGETSYYKSLSFYKGMEVLQIAVCGTLHSNIITWQQKHLHTMAAKLHTCNDRHIIIQIMDSYNYFNAITITLKLQHWQLSDICIQWQQHWFTSSSGICKWQQYLQMAAAFVCNGITFKYSTIVTWQCLNTMIAT